MKSKRGKTQSLNGKQAKLQIDLLHGKENIWLTKVAAIQHFKRESKVTELSFSKFACVSWSKMLKCKTVKLRRLKDLSCFCFGGPASS